MDSDAIRLIFLNLFSKTSSGKIFIYFVIGYLILCGSICGGYALSGGQLHVLFQPLELLISDQQSPQGPERSRTVCNVGHVMGAMGFLAGLLGIIHACNYRTGPEFLWLVGVSLAGVALGIIIGWGFALAIGHNIHSRAMLLHMQYRCINLAMSAHLRGVSPALALEAGTKDCRIRLDDDE